MFECLKFGLQASPEFKGIKTAGVKSYHVRMCFKPALNSKGLRLTVQSFVIKSQALQASPEFKGIKTRCAKRPGRALALQASPEFKGIKTHNPEDILCYLASSQP